MCQYASITLDVIECAGEYLKKQKQKKRALNMPGF